MKMQSKLKHIFMPLLVAVFGAFLPTDSAHAVGAIYQNADYNISLSANLHDGIWKVSPVYRLHTRFSDDATETRNSLDLRGELRYNDWYIAPSAGFEWDGFVEFGDSVRIGLQAVRNF